MLRDLLMRDVIGADERMVGILLPPSVGGVRRQSGRLADAASRGQPELHALQRRT